MNARGSRGRDRIAVIRELGTTRVAAVAPEVEAEQDEVPVDRAGIGRGGRHRGMRVLPVAAGMGMD